MIPALINLLILCLIGAVVYWIFTLLPLPEPFRKIVLVILLLIALLVLLNWAFPLVGVGTLIHR